MDLRELPDQPGQRHPWELARFGFFRGVLARSGALASAGSVLDAGAGDAWFARALLGHCAARRVVCWDAAYDPGARGQLGVSDSRITLVSEPPDERFDLVLALDVLEHIDEDREFLAALVARNLAPGGRILISVPAWQFLTTRHDHYLLHRRRYSPAQLTEVIRACRLRVDRRGGLFHSLLVPRAVSLVRERLGPRPGGSGASGEHAPLAWQHGALVTGLVRGALQIDTWLSRVAAARSLDLPGLSAWALCRQ